MYFQVCLHNGIPIDPDFRDVSNETWDLEAMCTFVRDNMPHLEDKPSVIERCIYTVNHLYVTGAITVHISIPIDRTSTGDTY